MNKIVYGDVIASNIKENLKNKVNKLIEEGKRLPHLVVIQLGDNPASNAYVSGKDRDCKEVGFNSTVDKQLDTISEEELLNLIDKYNNDNNVDGLLVQLPLPSHINEKNIINAINPSKDVDGFHPMNVGKMNIGEKTLLPCTPYGCIKILETIGYDDLSGKTAVVIGRSNIVGKPVATLLMQKNATVTIVHSRTKDIENICSQADIVIAAIGKARLIDSKWVKDGAVVIDVGINRDENGKLCGDVNLDDVLDKVSHITPVPKGVGLMTRAILLENTYEAYINSEE